MKPSFELEVEARLNKLRQAKTAAYRRGEFVLSSAELDEVLPPVSAYRESRRAAGMSCRNGRWRRAKPEGGAD